MAAARGVLGPGVRWAGPWVIGAEGSLTIEAARPWGGGEVTGGTDELIRLWELHTLTRRKTEKARRLPG